MKTTSLPANSVSLVVTSPPFLDVVQYAEDNWLRCWFLGIDPGSVQLTVPKQLDAWAAAMEKVFHELQRVLKPGGHVAFEVGEVRSGKVKLEETVLSCGVAAGLEPVLVLINDQQFTKTANCWCVANNEKGTNTNRVVVFRKPSRRGDSFRNNFHCVSVNPKPLFQCGPSAGGDSCSKGTNNTPVRSSSLFVRDLRGSGHPAQRTLRMHQRGAGAMHFNE